MRLRIVEGTRLPEWPRWAVAVVLIWLSCIGVIHFTSKAMGVNVVMCPMKLTAGYPCLTCGLTRGVDHLLHGRIIDGWWMNPLVFTIFLCSVIVLLVRAIFARKIQVVWNRNDKILIGSIFLAAIIVNWMYLIQTGK